MDIKKYSICQLLNKAEYDNNNYYADRERL